MGKFKTLVVGYQNVEGENKLTTEVTTTASINDEFVTFVFASVCYSLQDTIMDLLTIRLQFGG